LRRYGINQQYKLTENSNQSLGKKGENLACAYLEQKGHKIIFQNYRSGRSELDIISVIDKTLVISEVKSFQSIPLGAAEYRVNKRKQQQILQGSYSFLAENSNYEGYDVRIDVIIVNFSTYPAQVTHYEGAFYDNDSYFY